MRRRHAHDLNSSLCTVVNEITVQCQSDYTETGTRTPPWLSAWKIAAVRTPCYGTSLDYCNWFAAASLAMLGSAPLDIAAACFQSVTAPSSTQHNIHSRQNQYALPRRPRRRALHCTWPYYCTAPHCATVGDRRNKYSSRKFITPPPGNGWRSIVIAVSVCLSAIISPELHVRSSVLHQFFVRVSYGRGSVLLLQRCDMSCTSGFMDDVMSVHNGQE